MCNSRSLLHNLLIPWRNFFVDVTFFQKTRFLPQSSMRARAGHRHCNVSPAKCTRQNFPNTSSAWVVEKITSTKNSAVGQPIRADPGVAHSCLSPLDMAFGTFFPTSSLGRSGRFTRLFKSCHLRSRLCIEFRLVPYHLHPLSALVLVATNTVVFPLE